MATLHWMYNPLFIVLLLLLSTDYLFLLLNFSLQLKCPDPVIDFLLRAESKSLRNW